jgi:ribonuclease HI
VPLPADEDILRHIAQKERFTSTLKAFPGLTREQISRLLERMASLSESPRPKGGADGAPPRVRVYSDGAARGNPGPSGAGAVLVDTAGQVIDRLGKYLGVQTNNYAEYTGLILGLRRARELGVQEVEVFADSELMIRQLNGRYQVKSQTLRPLYEEALKLLGEFSRVKLVHVPREMNVQADEMSNRAIDQRM